MVRKNWIYLMVIFVGLFAVLFSACSQSPLQILQSDVLDTSLTPAFWAKEQKEQTDLWKAASAYCQSHTEKPNCGAVMQVFVITNGSTTAPAIGHSGHPIQLPSLES